MNDDIIGFIDDDDEEIDGTFCDAPNVNEIASFSFETPNEKEKKEKAIPKNIKENKVIKNSGDIINTDDTKVKDLRKRPVIPPVISSNEKCYKRTYLLKESTLKKLILLTTNEESLYFNVSSIVDMAINYYYDNMLKWLNIVFNVNNYNKIN